jgi:hypothetical protein
MRKGGVGSLACIRDVDVIRIFVPHELIGSWFARGQQDLSAYATVRPNANFGGAKNI